MQTYPNTIVSVGNSDPGSAQVFVNGVSHSSPFALAYFPDEYSTSYYSRKALPTLLPGNYTVSARVNGVMTPPISLDVVVGQPAVTLGMSADPSVWGQPRTANFVHTVPAGATPLSGDVTFFLMDYNGYSQNLGDATLVAGVASMTIPDYLMVWGLYVFAAWSADANYLAGSITAAFTINTADTTTSLVANPVANSTFADPVQLTATVAGVAPSTTAPPGSVTFKRDGVLLGTAPLNGAGQAVFTTRIINVGGHTLTAEYGATAGKYNASVSADVAFTVAAPASTVAAIGSTVLGSVFGQTVTFTVVVANPGGTPTGTVEYRDGAAVLGTRSLVGGIATFSIASLSVATHSIYGHYNGDGTYGAVDSNTLTFVVAQCPSTTALASSANPSVHGQSVTLTATVSPQSPGSGTPSGNVDFKNGGVWFATGVLSSAQATATTSVLPTAVNHITAEYLGDVQFPPSASSTLNQTVNKCGTSTVLSVDINPSSVGQLVTFSVTVNAVAPGSGVPTGTISLRDNGVEIANSALTAGSVGFPTAALAAGSHPITAVYSSDANFNGSTSATTTQVVT